MYDPVVVDTFAANIRHLEESTRDLGPESPTLRQIAELNNPANLPAVQASQVPQTPTPTTISESDWIAGLSGSTDLGSLAALTLGLASGFLPAGGCAIYVVDTDGATLFTASVAGLIPREYVGTKTDFGKKICGWVAANKVTAVNSIAGLDLDLVAGTRGLASSIVSPIVDGSNTVIGVLAFYSEVANIYSRDHQISTEAVCRMLYPSIQRISGTPTLAKDPPEQIEQLISQVEGRKGWWPVGVVVTRIESEEESVAAGENEWNVLRNLVRSEDSLVRIDSKAFLLLLLKSNNDTTREVAARIQERLAARGSKAVIEWASVDLEPGAENQAFTSLADAIHHTSMEADGRTRRTTH